MAAQLSASRGDAVQGLQCASVVHAGSYCLPVPHARRPVILAASASVTAGRSLSPNARLRSLLPSQLRPRSGRLRVVVRLPVREEEAAPGSPCILHHAL